MAHGNIYPAERVDAALANYFRPGNLGALRELALLWVADRVEESLHGYLDDHGISDAWETRERVVVGITGGAGGEALIRRAARMAGRVGGELIGVHVAVDDGLVGTPSDAAARRRNAGSSSELGGTVHEVVGGTQRRGAGRVCPREKATQLVLGASRRSRWHEARGTARSSPGSLASPATSTSTSSPSASRPRRHPTPRRVGVRTRRSTGDGSGRRGC